MTLVWPVELPQDVLVEGYDEKFSLQTIRTQVDAGPAKVRRRTSAGVRLLSCSLDLTRAQVDLLDQFYHATLQGGALSFEWKHPRTQAMSLMRLVDPPAMKPLSGMLWIAKLSLEILP